jgi:hypothetical protein
MASLHDGSPLSPCKASNNGDWASTRGSHTWIEEHSLQLLRKLVSLQAPAASLSTSSDACRAAAQQLHRSSNSDARNTPKAPTAAAWWPLWVMTST